MELIPPEEEIILKDGDTLDGIVLSAKKIISRMGYSILFTFLVDGKTRYLLTRSITLAHKINAANPNDRVVIRRTGIVGQTRWDVQIIPSYLTSLLKGVTVDQILPQSPKAETETETNKKPDESNMT